MPATVRERRWRKKRRVFCNGRHTGSNFARHESEQTSCPGASLREKLCNLFYEGRQMTARSGAPSTRAQNWNRVNWQQVASHVYRMQMRIAESIREGRWGKAQALQHILARSFYARLWAVKTIMTNKGSRTPGIDGVIWKTPGQYWQAALDLNARGYRARALRRIYIPKKNGRKRPLGIPTLHDRAMQALYALGLKPIAETVADKHSYGFRERRSLHDATKMVFNALSHKASAQWILEADIQACFDRISHDWLMKHIPLPENILRQWLKSGYMESSTLYDTDEGTPQGGIISPILCNMTLDGLEALVINGRNKKQRKLNIIRYADDFVITGASPDYLLQEIKPALERFLLERGLQLSQEKTQLSHISDGFNFLGFNFRKYENKLLVKPQDGKIKALLDKARDFLNCHHGIPYHVMLLKLNRIIRGWAYAYRKVVAKSRMQFADYHLYFLVRKWLSREHHSHTWGGIRKRYCKRVKGRVNFCAEYFSAKGESKQVCLFRASDLPIRYHNKVRCEATPYDPAYREYFKQREMRFKREALIDRMKMSRSSFEKLVA